MLKKTSIVLLSTLVVAIIALFAATAVMAACGKDITFLFIRNSDGTYTQTAYSIAFKGVNFDTSTQKYKWEYDISSSGANSEYDILTPACNNGCQTPVTYTGVTSVVVNDPGQGDKNTGFGVGDFQARVIQMPSNIQSGNSIWFYTDRLSAPEATSLQVKAGKTLLFAKDINGPSCPRPPQEPSLREKNLVIEGMHVKLLIDKNECAQEAYVCDQQFLNCQPLTAVTVTASTSDGALIDSTVRQVGETDGNQRCVWGRVFLADSPGCTLIDNGAGGYYKVGDTCKCTSTTQCAPGYVCGCLSGSTCTTKYCKPY